MHGPVLHLIGNAHLDPAWLWHWPEGFAEGRATFASALDRMEEYPGFVFTAGAAVLYQWIERTDPVLFARIQARVAEGRWCIVGGWHTQSDCNMPSGESFARNALYSQRYFKDKFGHICETGYCVDSFGHTGSLPQLLEQGGMRAYVFMRPAVAENPRVPTGPFVWEGVDGTRVLAFHIYYGYGNDNVWELNQQLKAISKASPPVSMCFFGVGDHGGGPTKELLNHLDTLMAEGQPMAYSSPDRYFEKLALHTAALPVFRGEMLNHAVGCYSAESRIKLANRRAEWLLLAAERMASVAQLIGAAPLSLPRLAEAWKDVLFGHFHDILAGTCERRVCDQSLEQYGRASQTASEILAESVQRIGSAVDTSGPGLGLLVFNPHAFPVSTLIETDDVFVRRDRWDVSAVHMLDAFGAVAPHQNIATATLHNDARLVFPVDLPALGWRLLRVTASKRSHPSEPQLSPPAFAPLSGRLAADETTLENEHLRLAVDASGRVHLRDVVLGWDVFAGGGGVPKVFDDPSDTWGSGVKGFDSEAGVFELESKALIETGPLRARLRLRFAFGSSRLTLDYVLERFARTVRLDAVLDWRERHRVLKLVFPVQVESPVWTTEIPYGEAVRPADGTESPMQGWTDLSDAARGLAIANDSKYGVDARGDTIRITIVRSPVYVHQARYALRTDECYQDQGLQDFRLLLMPHGPDWRAEVSRQSHLLNCPPVLSWEGTHLGRLPTVYGPLVDVRARNVVMMALKRAEQGGAWILRAFGNGEGPEPATFFIPSLGRLWSAEFTPGKVKTFHVPDALGEPVRETNFLED